MDIKHPRSFIKELEEPVYQTNFTERVRLGVIDSVDPAQGTCRLSWMDKPGFKEDVLLTQANDGEWHIPKEGAVAIVFFDHKEQARIVRYMNLGHISLVEQMVLPSLKEGEKLWELNGTYIHLKQNGNIQFYTASGTELTLDNVAGTFQTVSVNWKIITDGGTDYFGVVKRLVVNADGTSSIKVISDIFKNPYTEKRTKVFEHPKKAISFLSDTPLVDITVGTVIDNDGNIVDRTGVFPVIPAQEVAVLITFASNVKLSIAKNGVVTMWNAKLNINNGSVDVTNTDDIHALNDPTLGTKGQHVAREHDQVTIPISPAYTDAEHVTLANKSTLNIATLTQLAGAFVSPSGPCVFNPALLVGNVALEGEVTEGATNVVVGD